MGWLPCVLSALPTGVEPDESSPGRQWASPCPSHAKQRCSMCQTARGTKQWDLHALTGRPAGGGVGLARSVESMSSLRRREHGYLP